MIYASWGNAYFSNRFLELKGSALPLNYLVYADSWVTLMTDLWGDRSIVGEHIRLLIHYQVDHARCMQKQRVPFFRHLNVLCIEPRERLRGWSRFMRSTWTMQHIH
jgi:hypothetical protein